MSTKTINQQVRRAVSDAFGVELEKGETLAQKARQASRAAGRARASGGDIDAAVEKALAADTDAAGNPDPDLTAGQREDVVGRVSRLTGKGEQALASWSDSALLGVSESYEDGQEYAALLAEHRERNADPGSYASGVEGGVSGRQTESGIIAAKRRAERQAGATAETAEDYSAGIEGAREIPADTDGEDGPAELAAKLDRGEIDIDEFDRRRRGDNEGDHPEDYGIGVEEDA